MNEYPEWLIAKVAQVLADAALAYVLIPGGPEDRFIPEAAAALDALGFAPYGGPSYWRSNIQWEAK